MGRSKNKNGCSVVIIKHPSYKEHLSTVITADHHIFIRMCTIIRKCPGFGSKIRDIYLVHKIPLALSSFVVLTLISMTISDVPCTLKLPKPDKLPADTEESNYC